MKTSVVAYDEYQQNGMSHMKITIELDTKEDRYLPIFYGCELANAISDIMSTLRYKMKHEELTDEQHNLVESILGDIVEIITDHHDIPLTVIEDE